MDYITLLLICFLDSYSFSICDTSNFSEYEKGGVATEVKETKTLSFVSLLQ